VPVLPSLGHILQLSFSHLTHILSFRVHHFPYFFIFFIQLSRFPLTTSNNQSGSGPPIRYRPFLLVNTAVATCHNLFIYLFIYSWLWSLDNEEALAHQELLRLWKKSIYPFVHSSIHPFIHSVMAYLKSQSLDQLYSFDWQNGERITSCKKSARKRSWPTLMRCPSILLHKSRERVEDLSQDRQHTDRDLQNKAL
jgi:hypothetical protein